MRGAVALPFSLFSVIIAQFFLTTGVLSFQNRTSPSAPASLKHFVQSRNLDSDEFLQLLHHPNATSVSPASHSIGPKTRPVPTSLADDSSMPVLQGSSEDRSTPAVSFESNTDYTTIEPLTYDASMPQTVRSTLRVDSSNEFDPEQTLLPSSQDQKHTARLSYLLDEHSDFRVPVMKNSHNNNPASAVSFESNTDYTTIKPLTYDVSMPQTVRSTALTLRVDSSNEFNPEQALLPSSQDRKHTATLTTSSHLLDEQGILSLPDKRDIVKELPESEAVRDSDNILAHEVTIAEDPSVSTSRKPSLFWWWWRL